jgi:signal transduction histidine kinase
VVWVPIEVSRLRLELRAALVEVRRSRARLAEAAAAERRRLEQDLHDGAQQHLLAIGMRLRLLQRELAGVQAAEIDAAVHDLQGTVDELRRLAHGVRPSRLDDGLAAALAAVRAAAPLPFTLVVEELPALDDTRALTAYLVVSEAVANVLKHAMASRVDVRVSTCDGGLAVEVRDDGIGGVRADEPLSALRDRVLSVGGTIRVDSPAGVGTTISAVL